MTLATATPHVLIVDDEEQDVDLLREAIALSGVTFHIHTVQDGDEALEFLRRQGPYEDVPRPDLVLLDLNMPRMNGHETLEAIKSDPDLKRIPVIIFSTSNDPKDVRESYDRHANSYVTKPYQFEALQEVARTIEAFWIRTAASASA